MKLIIRLILLLILKVIYAAEINPCNGIITGNVPHPDPQNCGSYIFCMMTFPNLRSCPPNTVFVPHANASIHDGSCEPGNPETCEVFTTTFETSTPTDTTTELDDPTQTTENEINTTTIPEFTTDEPKTTENIQSTTATTTSRFLPTTTPIPVHRCPPSGFGYIPHHTNCSRYFECIAGIRHMRFCHYGLLFDSVTLRCTYPELAVCAGHH